MSDSEHIDLRGILKMLGETYDDPQLLRYAKKRLQRRISNVEEQTGTRILFGGGGKGGRKLWTTKSALRHVWPHLVPEQQAVTEEIADVAKDITERFEDRVSELEMKVDILTAELVKTKEICTELRRTVT